MPKCGKQWTGVRNSNMKLVLVMNPQITSLVFIESVENSPKHVRLPRNDITSNVNKSILDEEISLIEVESHARRMNPKKVCELDGLRTVTHCPDLTTRQSPLRTPHLQHYQTNGRCDTVRMRMCGSLGRRKPRRILLPHLTESIRR